MQSYFIHTVFMSLYQKSAVSIFFFILSGGSCCQPRASTHNHIRRIFHIQHRKFLGFFFSCKISHRLLTYLEKKEICTTYKCTSLHCTMLDCHIRMSTYMIFFAYMFYGKFTRYDFFFHLCRWDFKKNKGVLLAY